MTLSLVMMLSCFVACDKEPADDGKGTTQNGDSANNGGNNADNGNKTPTTSTELSDMVAEINAFKAEDFEETTEKTEYLKVVVKDYGEIVVVLREDIAPISVKNFKKLVADKFYDGMIFHRVIENFMIQGGGGTEIKDGKLSSKYANPIKGEFYVNGVPNNLRHQRGVISMARTSNYDTASSQFFIMHADSASLDGSYASFGYVLAGMDVVDAIATCEVDKTDKDAPVPVTPVVIETMSFVKPK